MDMLLKIDDDLDSQEVEELKFLCRDLVPPKQLETVEAAQDLFLQLQDQGLLGDDCLLLAELLLTIRRLDLLRVLGTSEKEVKKSVREQAGSYRGLSPYRKMLFELSENVTEETLKSFKYLSGLPRSRLQSCTSFLDVLVEMEKLDRLREDSTEELELIFGECNKLLAAKVKQYTARLAGGITMQPVSVQEQFGRGNLQPRAQQQSHRPSVQEPHHGMPLTSVCRVESLSLDAVPERSPDLDPEDYYKTSSRPLGYCLIINNYSFKEARQRGKFLGDRKGTNQDAELLRTVFTRLHFKVDEKKDQTGEQMERLVRDFARVDHGALDVFACCVLSHGEKGSVYAADGASVRIRTLTQPFTSSHCPSLALKPKLFFIQACQGQDLQRGALIQADGTGEEEEEGEEEEGGQGEDYRVDAASFGPSTVPDESDFLLGMATVEDYRSFRSVKHGSIFIQELCRQLVHGCEQREDILTIMTRVNREVSSGVYLHSKQMPEPRYTLRKKLVLPID